MSKCWRIILKSSLRHPKNKVKWKIPFSGSRQWKNMGKNMIFFFLWCFLSFLSFLCKHLRIYNAPGKGRENDETINIPGFEGVMESFFFLKHLWGWFLNFLLQLQFHNFSEKQEAWERRACVIFSCKHDMKTSGWELPFSAQWLRAVGSRKEWGLTSSSSGVSSHV